MKYFSLFTVVFLDKEEKCLKITLLSGYTNGTHFTVNMKGKEIHMQGYNNNNSLDNTIKAARHLDRHNGNRR